MESELNLLKYELEMALANVNTPDPQIQSLLEPFKNFKDEQQEETHDVDIESACEKSTPVEGNDEDLQIVSEIEGKTGAPTQLPSHTAKPTLSNPQRPDLKRQFAFKKLPPPVITTTHNTNKVSDII